MAESQENLIEIIVGPEARGVRLDRWLAGTLIDPDRMPVSRSRIQRLLAAGDIRVDGVCVPGKHLLAGGELVRVHFGAVATSLVEPVAMPLTILFEDHYLMVIDKPAGIAMHPGAGDTGPTLVQGLLHHVQSCGSTLSVGQAQRPGIVHRLDKDTSGVVVVAKTEAAHATLAKQFHDKTNLRVYACLLDGFMSHSELEYESYLYRDPRDRLKFASLAVADYEARGMTSGRYARTWLRRELVYGHRLTLARVVLATGRTHQIRVHAAALGLPIVGDPVYNRPSALPNSFSPEVRAAVKSLTRQMLHAEVLGFTHPASGETMRFHAPYPKDFLDLLDVLEPYAQDAIM